MNYYLVPLEGDMYLVNGTESRVLSEEDLEYAHNLRKEGLSPQEVLASVWYR